MTQECSKASSTAANAGGSQLPWKGAELPLRGLVSGKMAGEEIKERQPDLLAKGGTYRNFKELG